MPDELDPVRRMGPFQASLAGLVALLFDAPLEAATSEWAGLVVEKLGPGSVELQSKNTSALQPVAQRKSLRPEDTRVVFDLAVERMLAVVAAAAVAEALEDALVMAVTRFGLWWKAMARCSSCCCCCCYYRC